MLQVLEMLQTHARASRVALVNREERLTYQELDVRSDAFASFLLDRLGEDRSPVIIYGEKETAFLCCLLGALKAGRAYVPIDRTVPRERAAQIAADVAPKVIVDLGGFDPPAGEFLVLTKEQTEEILRRPGPPVPRDRWVNGEQTVYILFTSGSTGRPKGVPITAANLESFCRGLLPWYPQEEGGVILHQISYRFPKHPCFPGELLPGVPCSRPGGDSPAPPGLSPAGGPGACAPDPAAGDDRL